MRIQGLNVYVILRIAVGALLLFSGVTKILEPYQNFLYVVQGYSLMGDTIERIIAYVIPWPEFFIGLFLILGLWLKAALRSAFVLFLGFVGVVGQALLRKLPLEECGCFGEMIHLAPYQVIVLDTCIAVLTIILIEKIEKTQKWSLDQYLSESSSA